MPIDFHTFALSYVLARAPTFARGDEVRDAWNALQDAKTVFLQAGATARGLLGTQEHWADPWAEPPGRDVGKKP